MNFIFFQFILFITSSMMFNGQCTLPENTVGYCFTYQSIMIPKNNSVFINGAIQDTIFVTHECETDGNIYIIRSQTSNGVIHGDEIERTIINADKRCICYLNEEEHLTKCFSLPLYNSLIAVQPNSGMCKLPLCVGNVYEIKKSQVCISDKLPSFVTLGIFWKEGIAKGGLSSYSYENEFGVVSTKLTNEPKRIEFKYSQITQKMDSLISGDTTLEELSFLD